MSTTTMLNISEEAYICSGATTEEIQHFTRIDWWIQGLLQLIICIIGLTGNTVAIPILCSNELDSVFYRLLVFLAIFDNIYLTCALFEAWRSKFVVPWSKFHHSVFHAHVLYPIHNIVLCCSAYMTAGIAFERYFAVYRPIEYYNRIINNGRSPWFRSIFYYTIPVLLFCTFVNIPKFFELNAVLNGSNEVQIVPTTMRLDHIYIVYYHHYTRLIVTGLIPFFMLLYCNIKIYQIVIKRDRATEFNCRSTTATSVALEWEKRQAIILVLIIVLFLLCNIPRLFLTILETFSVKEFKEDYLHNCSGVSVWILFTASISHILLTFNCSINFFVYCFMSSLFRNVMKSWTSKKMKQIKTLFYFDRREQNSSITYYSQNSFKKKESIQAQNVQVDEGLEESKMEQTPSKSRNVLIPLTENILPLYEETKIDENGTIMTSL